MQFLEMEFMTVADVGLDGLQEFLRAHAEYSTRAAIKACEEVLRLQRRVEDLERQSAIAEVRCVETQINALREHQNAWAMLMLCVKSGVEVAGFEQLTEAHCRRRIMELQIRLTDAIAQAQVQADRLGMQIRMGIPEGSDQVQIRLQPKGEGARSSRSVS